MHYTAHKMQLEAFPCTFDLALLITKRHHKLTYNNLLRWNPKVKLSWIFAVSLQISYAVFCAVKTRAI